MELPPPPLVDRTCGVCGVTRTLVVYADAGYDRCDCGADPSSWIDLPEFLRLPDLPPAFTLMDMVNEAVAARRAQGWDGDPGDVTLRELDNAFRMLRARQQRGGL